MMKKLISRTLAACIGISLFGTFLGCQTLLPSDTQSIYVSGLTFQNIASDDAQNVRLRAISTNGQVSCNKIEVNSTCGTGFPAKYYQAGELELSWQMAGRSYAEHFVIPTPVDAEENREYTAVVLLTNNGQYDVRLTKNNTL